MNNHTEDKTVFDVEKINEQLAAIADIHNNTIQSCIDVFEKELASWGVSFQANPNRKFFDQFYQDIISKLNNLKK